MALTYDIEIRYLESGNLGGKIGDINQKLSGLKSGFGELSTGIGDALVAVGAVTAGILGMGLAGATAIAGLGASVVKLNADLEDTTIAFAATFASFGAAKDFNQGIGIATEQISKMRKDAADLPGEFKDLANIMQSIAPSALGQAQMSPDEMRKFAARTMAVAHIDRIPMPVAAREMAALLEGKAGSQNILGRKMMGLTGDKAKEFNALSGVERKKVLNKELFKDAYTDAIGAYSRSFTGLFSTLKDNLKLVGTQAGGSLFEHVKTALTGINTWFGHNQGQIAVWSGKIGTGLADAFDFGVAAFQRWWGPITTFFGQLGHEVKSIWSALSPLFEGMGESLRKSLENGSALERLKSVLGMYAMLKIGAPLVGGIGRSVGGLVGGMTPGLGSMLGTGAISAGAGAGVLGAAGAATALVVLAGAAGQLSAMLNENSTHHEDAMRAASALSTQFDLLWGNLNVSIIPAFEALGVGMTKFLAEVIGGVNDMLHPLESARVALNAFSPKMGDAMKEYFDPKLNPTVDDRTFKSPYELDPAFARSVATGINNTKTPPPPNHSTHISKVEIVVNTNQDPQRVARLTVDELAKLMKNPKGSKRIPSFLASR